MRYIPIQVITMGIRAVRVLLRPKSSFFLSKIETPSQSITDGLRTSIVENFRTYVHTYVRCDLRKHNFISLNRYFIVLCV